MEGIANGGALGEGHEVSVLVEGALGWPMLADIVEVAEGDECRWNQREVKMVVFEDPIIPFVSLLKTKVGLEEDLLHMPARMAEVEDG